MKAVVVDKNAKADWDAFVMASPDTISWHMYDFNKVIQNNYNVTYYPLAAYDNDEICGILPLYHVKTALTKDILISCPYVVAGGIVANDKATADILMDAAIALSKKHKDCKIILKQYKIKYGDDLLTDANFYNRELDLTQSEKEIWDGFDEHNRKMIKAAESYDLTLEYPSNDIDSFYKVVFAQHHQKGIPCPSKKWIAGKYGFADYSYRLALMKRNGKTVAVTMAKVFKKTVSLPYTAIIDHSEETQTVVYKLYWDLIRQLKKEGIEICHSGRVPNNETVDKYRLGWGGTKEPYYYQYYPNTGVQTEFAVKRGKKRQLFEKVWRILPGWLVRICGPMIVKQFP